MTIHYNVTGNERKRLADYIAGFLGCEKKYLGVPSCAYQAGYIMIQKDGAIEFDDRADSEEIEKLLEELAQEGFHAEAVGAETAQSDTAETDTSEAEKGAQCENVGLTVEVPLSKVNVGNLTNLLDAKGVLIQKALGIDTTPIEIGEDTVSFPWFSELPEPDAAKAYTHLISALCEMSVIQKRITAKEKAVDNEKYAFRCLLLRLGFIGAEYKSERKILLQNLSGSSAFKCGAKKEVADNAVSE
ncbi:virulence protein [Clostridium botulinum]|uniref:virulence protein n=1 Tax=Clostridium botulinum TaxID=1491 RepID=UPI00196A084F|nr:virulence protein [Clostridium botulinum]MBN3368719.1 virulence protein [Clostridium botulinum]